MLEMMIQGLYSIL